MELTELRKLIEVNDSLTEGATPKNAKDIPVWSVLTAKETITFIPPGSKTKKKVTLKKGQEFSVTAVLEKTNAIKFDKVKGAKVNSGWQFAFTMIIKHFDIEIQEVQKKKKSESYKEQYNKLPKDTKNMIDNVIKLIKNDDKPKASDVLDAFVKANKLVNWEVSVLSNIALDLSK